MGAVLRDTDCHRATMRAYYHAHKDKWKRYRKTKSQKEFKAKRNKCIWYLKNVRGWSYKAIARRLSIYDPDSVWRMLKHYEKNLNATAPQKAI